MGGEGDRQQPVPPLLALVPAQGDRCLPCGLAQAQPHGSWWPSAHPHPPCLPSLACSAQDQPTGKEVRVKQLHVSWGGESWGPEKRPGLGDGLVGEGSEGHWPWPLAILSSGGLGKGPL